MNTARYDLALRMPSPKQQIILELISEGLRCNEIATKLCISKKTVGSHITKLHLLAGTHNYVALVRWGLRMRYISMESMLK